MDSTIPVEPRSYRVGVDIGGTFTDVVVAAEGGNVAVTKVLSTPENYADGVVAGTMAALKQLGIDVGGPSEVVHATTVATNAILEHRGARCALITTAGFRDVLEIGRLRIPELYNLFYDKRPVLIPRDRIFEVTERVNHRGEVIVELDNTAMRHVLDSVIASGSTSVAICLLNAYANPLHEQRIASALRLQAPQLDVSTSADILPRIGEYERTSTTVINAYVQPMVRRYLNALVDLLQTNSIKGPLFIMQSSGGLMGAERAVREAVTMIESGPAAGVLAAKHFMDGLDLPNAVTFDMGGTTAKASIIEKGTILKSSEYEVGGAMSATTRLTGGGGYPISVPAVDIAEVGAGGGSIVWIDSGGSLRVGPESSGAAPGPACYGKGGTRPTVTDANLILGYLNPMQIAGGAIGIRPELARAALLEHVALPLGLELAEAAFGVHLIANSEMMGAIRAVSTQRGRDIRNFALISFGGCGPLHAALLAQEMGISTVVVPQHAGLFSAFGLLTTERVIRRSRTLYAEAGELTQGSRLKNVIGAIRAEVVEEFRREAEATAVDLEIAADIRYWGQSYDLTVTAPADLEPPDMVRTLVERFEEEHHNTYGHRAKGERVIIAAIHISARSPSAALRLRDKSTTRVAVEHKRDAYFGAEHGWLSTPVLLRGAVPLEAESGPLLIEEYDTVIVVPPGCTARRDQSGNILLSIEKSRRVGSAAMTRQTADSVVGVTSGAGRDPVVFELVKNSLFFLVNDMAHTLVRASYSGILRENMDFSTGIADANGEMVSQGLSLPMQFGPMPDAVSAVRARWEGRIEQGDVFVLNDPFEGGTHLPDVFFIKPLFQGRELLCYTCVAGHQVDVGGRVAGSNACDSTEVYAEGLRIPPLKLYERGVPNETLFNLIERNVRVPVKVLGDFRAQVAALETGEKGIIELVERYGVDILKQYFAELLDYAERQTRKAIRELPVGTYAFVDYIDSDGIERRPVPIKLQLIIAGDRVIADFAGSSPQVQGAINSTMSMAKSSTYAAIRSVLQADIPSNGGFFRAIDVIAEKGSILDCVLPAASGGRGVTLFRIVDTVFGALAQAVPERVYAACEGGNTVYSIGGYDENRQPFVLVEIFGGSWGGRPDRDGVDGISHIALNQRNIPAEIMEAENPVELWHYGFVPDTGGAGKFRGGLSLVRELRYVGSAPAQLQLRSDRCDHLPYGLAGGGQGTPSYNLVNPGTARERPLRAMDTTTIQPGDVIRFVTPGAGGWGDPKERDRTAVHKDVREGRLTHAYVHEHYGIGTDDAVPAGQKR